MRKPLHHLFVSAFVYGGLALASGLFFREFTKANGFPEDGVTQLGLAHTHLFSLGFFPFLILLGLERVFRLSAAPRLFGWFLWLYHAGIAITAGMLIVHGTLTVLGIASSPMISGIAGLGHIALTAAIVVLFFLIRSAIRRVPADGADTAAAPALP
ncbi:MULTISPECIES: DUF2871 domain-containing protein [Leucobacter]|uniref:DUF2871 domain-containing protein n=1 Tax=Leucobacter iarius TaxID=333963 RepID=A0ABN2LW81_9MICO